MTTKTDASPMISVASMNAQMQKLKTVMQKQIDVLEQQLVDDAAAAHELAVGFVQERDVIKPALLGEIERLRAEVKRLGGDAGVEAETPPTPPAPAPAAEAVH